MKNHKSYTVDEATKLMEHYCAYQERCHKEVEVKLSALNMIPEAKEKIMLHLLQHNFLNEERFAKAFVLGKYSVKKWGKIKIVAALKYKNISTYNIKSALLQINEIDYINTLQTLARKKNLQIKEPNNYKRKAKLSNYLLSKGFESNLVYETVFNLIGY